MVTLMIPYEVYQEQIKELYRLLEKTYYQENISKNLKNSIAIALNKYEKVVTNYGKNQKENN